MRAQEIFFALVSSMLVACGRTPSARVSTEGGRPAPEVRVPRLDAFDVRPAPEVFGPANPWGDGGLPRSTATGPEAEHTLAAMTALRASIGFWRIERHMRDRCPTLDNLAGTPAAMFDPATMHNDAWGQPFEVECQGARVRVRSPGADRVRNTSDDLWAQ